jgi:hypothetical protein
MIVRAILPRPVAAADAEAGASDLGRIGLLHAHARERLPHALQGGDGCRLAAARTRAIAALSSPPKMKIQAL